MRGGRSWPGVGCRLRQGHVENASRLVGGREGVLGTFYLWAVKVKNLKQEKNAANEMRNSFVKPIELLSRL